MVLGDAACAFNPVYGQGMAAGAQAALPLQQCLRSQRQHWPNGDLSSLSHTFQKQLAKVNAIPWLLATSEDFRYPTTEGSQPDWLTHQLHRYMNQVLLSATHHRQVHQRFMEVLHLLKPPRALFQPSILAQVFSETIKQALRDKPCNPQSVISNRDAGSIKP